MSTFESMLMDVMPRLAETSKRKGITFQMLFCGTLEEMKKKHKNIIKKRESYIRDGLENDWLEIYILGYSTDKEFEVVEEGKDFIIVAEERVAYIEDPTFERKYNERSTEKLTEYQKFTLQDLEYVLFD